MRVSVAGIMLGLILLLCRVDGRAQGQNIIDQKEELQQIKQDIENTQRNLDSLKNIEKGVLQEISDYEQRALLNQTVINRLNNQLSSLRKGIKESGGHLEQAEQKYTASRGRYINNLKFYYAGTKDNYLAYDDNWVLERDALLRLTYLRALAAADREQVTESSILLSQAETDYNSLVSEEQTVGTARKQKRQEFTILTSQKEKREKDLSQVRRSKENEADRLVTLSEAARQMEELIARLEQARRDRELADRPTEFDFQTGNFASYKGGLSAPIKGKIVKRFGWKTDKVTNLKSFSPGIEINGRAGAAVSASARGVVAYVGRLRGYGNFVIVEHEDGYFSTYAGLEEVYVDKNQIVSKGDRLGTAATGQLKFELRRGKESLDPVEWIRIDTLN